MTVNEHQNEKDLRDTLAMLALNGMLAHATRYKPRHIDCEVHWHDAIAKEAYEIADAMMRQRSKEIET